MQRGESASGEHGEEESDQPPGEQPTIPDERQVALAEHLPYLDCHNDWKQIGQMINGLSAVYTFYDPEEHRRSLGRYAILWQIEEARRSRLDSLYLGYWIKNCRKMNYKTEYRPIEMLVNQRWVAIT